MFTPLKKRCLTAISIFFGLAAILCLTSVSFAWDNFEFSEASLPTYERLRNVPENELPKAIKKAVLTSNKKSLAVALETYALDVRYANILGRICASLTPNLPRVYSLPYYVELKALNQLPSYQGNRYTSNTLGQYTPTNERLIIGSFAANKSYNSFASSRIILLDSFILDTLYRVAQYKAYCGSYDNAYEQALAVYATKVEKSSSKRGTVAKFTDISHGLIYRPNANITNPYLPFSLSENFFSNQSGLKWEPMSFHSIDRDGVKWANPAHIPLPNGYDSSLLDREATRNFEKLLAPVLCHEISHCLLEHSQARLNKTVSLKKRLDELMTPGEANAEVRRFLTTKLTPDQERQADIYAAKLGKSIGLRVQDFEEGFWFLGLVEKAQGRSVGFDTHPQYVERRRLVERVYMNEL